MIQDRLTQAAHRFLREEIDPRRDVANAKMFKTESTQVRESTVVIAPKRIEPSALKNEEVLFSPNSNAQGI